MTSRWTRLFCFRPGREVDEAAQIFTSHGRHGMLNQKMSPERGDSPGGSVGSGGDSSTGLGAPHGGDGCRHQTSPASSFEIVKKQAVRRIGRQPRAIGRHRGQGPIPTRLR